MNHLIEKTALMKHLHCLIPQCYWMALLALTCFPTSAMSQIQVTSDFEGGSAEIVSIDAAKQALHIRPKVEPGRGFPCWWYFRIDNVNPEQQIIVTISETPKAFQNKRVLGSTWSRPDQAAISTDKINWKQTPVGTRDKSSITYKFKAQTETVWLAWGPPFLPSDSEKLLQLAKTKIPSAEIFELAKTRKGRPVQAIRFGAKTTSNNKPFGIWIQARQHAWEAGSSWVGQGFLLWAISDAPAAVELRRTTTICFVPIMDIDSVAEGFGGKDSLPRDHNRDWDKQPFYPEVKAAQQKIMKMNENGTFDVFIDLHNPGPSDRKPFFFGPDLTKLSKQQRRNFVHWLAGANSLISGSVKNYRLTTYIKSTEVLNRMSSNWVRNHTAPHVLSTTLETSWNCPEGTPQGYQKVGNQLGMSIARYLTTSPRQ